MARSTNIEATADRTIKLVIGYDGSDCAEAAIRDLRRAGLPARVDATVVSVADLLVEVPYAEWGHPGSVTTGPLPAAVREARQAATDAMAEARQAAARGAGIVTSLFPGWAVRAEVVAGSPYWALVTKAGQTPPDLVVVGSHGRSGLGRLILGSVSQNVLSHAPCSVRIGRCRAESGDGVRSGTDPGANAGVRIVVGIDGSDDAAAAADVVLTRCWPVGTEVRAVMAVDLKLSMSLAASLTSVGTWTEPPAGHRDLASAARHYVDAVAGRLQEAGLSAVGVVVDGEPRKALVEEAERWGADCIFVGAKGHGRLERFLVGSVSAAVAARAHCSVEVVRRRA